MVVAMRWTTIRTRRLYSAPNQSLNMNPCSLINFWQSSQWNKTLGCYCIKIFRYFSNKLDTREILLKSWAQWICLLLRHCRREDINRSCWYIQTLSLGSPRSKKQVVVTRKAMILVVPCRLGEPRVLFKSPRRAPPPGGGRLPPDNLFSLTVSPWLNEIKRFVVDINKQVSAANRKISAESRCNGHQE